MEDCLESFASWDRPWTPDGQLRENSLSESLTNRGSMELAKAGGWGPDWAWGIPLIVLTSVVHVFGLGLINERIVWELGEHMDRRRPTFLAATMSVAVLFATLLHTFEAALWAAAYLWLRALPDLRTAMLYSVSALTTYGHANALLPDRWRMLGALEALNGMLLFGLSTAFLFAVIQEVWSLRSSGHRPARQR